MYEKSRQTADSKACCDYAMHFILSQFDPKISKEMELLVKEKGVNSFRVFLSNTNDMLVDDGDFFEIAKRCRDLGAVLQVHAENGKLVRILESKIYNDGITGPEGYLYSHPEMVSYGPKIILLSLFKIFSNKNSYWLLLLSAGFGLLLPLTS